MGLVLHAHEVGSPPGGIVQGALEEMAGKIMAGVVHRKFFGKERRFRAG